MKKKILMAASAVAFVCLAITTVFFVRNRLNFKRTESATPAKPQAAAHLDEMEENAPHLRDALGGETDTKTLRQAAAPGYFAKNENKKQTENDITRSKDPAADLGRVFIPSAASEGTAGRRLEYNIAVSYQIELLKPARAFFNQWIPRYGFLISESAAGHQNGYMSLQVRIRSSQLYAALTDLDAIGALTSENITVTDHTENSVYQQILAAREEIRNRRRTLANANTGTGAKNWEATENLLSQSEDKQLQTRIEEWRIGDRTGWATLHITVALPVTTTVAPVEVPEFRNAFVGLLNVLLQLLYALIYLIPLAALAYAVYRISLRFSPALRRLLPRPGGNTGAPA